MFRVCFLDTKKKKKKKKETFEYKTTVTVRRGRRSRTPFTNSKTNKK